MKPGGSIFITTQNKTLATWLVVIVLSEYVFRKIPFGTHEWDKFIAPHEVQRILDNCKSFLLIRRENYQKLFEILFKI